jgi:protease-4
VIVSSKAFTEKIQDHLENKRTKALLIRVNSPGGIVAPSQEMYEAVRRADEKIPVFVTMGSVAASGGYYLSLGARRIFANPGTLTASIGVIMEFANTEKLYQWAKIDRFSITSGKFKDAGSPFRPMKPEERALFNLMVQDIYRQFRDTVRVRRKLSEEELESSTDGRVMTGRQALESRLVDELGGAEDALRELKKTAGLSEDAEVLYPEDEKGMLEEILLGKDDSKSLLRDWALLLARLASGDKDSAGYLLPVSHQNAGWQALWLAPLATQ